MPLGHSSCASKPVLGHLNPASHCLQSLSPSTSEYVPLAQIENVDNPLLGHCAPLGHGRQTLLPDVEYVPARHSIVSFL